MRTDFTALEDGDRVVLFPNKENPIHFTPVRASYCSGYFYCDGTDPVEGPDYYFGDVLKYNHGFELSE